MAAKLRKKSINVIVIKWIKCMLHETHTDTGSQIINMVASKMAAIFKGWN